MNYIKDKNILLLCYNFFEYDKMLMNKLYELGAKNVYLKTAAYFASSPRDDMFWHPIYKSPYLYLKDPHARSKWTKQFQDDISDLKFDVFLVIENTSFKKSFMRFLRDRNPGIKTIWFLWDTFKIQQKFHKDYIKLFDKVYTFDRDDAYRYNLSYYPNFYVEPKGKSNNLYDICFVGSANSSVTSFRIEAIAKIKKQCDALGLRSYFYVKVEPRTKSKNVFKRIFRYFVPCRYDKMLEKYYAKGFLHTKGLSQNEFNDVIRDSSAIIDLSYPDRQGMTINAIAAIASGKKLVTTNYKIEQEPFFHFNNILIIDQSNPVIDIGRLKLPMTPVNVDYLRMENWLQYIINT